MRKDGLFPNATCMWHMLGSMWMFVLGVPLLESFSLCVMHTVVAEAVAQTDATEGELQSAASGDSQQKGFTPEGLYDADDGADSALAKSGRKRRSQAGQKVPPGQHRKALLPEASDDLSLVCVAHVVRLCFAF